jgi:hypothetical protein
LKYKSISQTNWNYCSKEDPRFHEEIQGGLEVGGPLRKVTSHSNASLLPIGCYDTIDGYFDPQKAAVLSYEDNTIVLRIPEKSEREWIVKNCRVGSTSEVLSHYDTTSSSSASNVPSADVPSTAETVAIASAEVADNE